MIESGSGNPPHSGRQQGGGAPSTPGGAPPHEEGGEKANPDDAADVTGRHHWPTSRRASPRTGVTSIPPPAPFSTHRPWYPSASTGSGTGPRGTPRSSGPGPTPARPRPGPR